MLQATAIMESPWSRLTSRPRTTTFPLLLANLHAPTARVERNGRPAFRIQLPTDAFVETRLEGLRRTGNCMPPVLEVDRSPNYLTAVVADEGWPALVDALRPEATLETRQGWVLSLLHLLSRLEQNQPWMAQLPFRPEHLELRGSAMRLTIAGLAWMVRAPIRLQTCPLRNAADILDTLFPVMGPDLEQLVLEWRTSPRVTLSDAIAGWSQPAVPKRRALTWPLAGGIAGASLLGVLMMPRPTAHVSHAAPKPAGMRMVARWLKQVSRGTIKTLSVPATLLEGGLPRPVLETRVDMAHHRLTDADLAGRSARELTLLRNEIYARHGRRFNDPELGAWFEQQPWYREDAAYRDDCLSAQERENACIILTWQASRHLTW